MSKENDVDDLESSPFRGYVIPSIGIAGIGMTVGGFMYGLKRQKKKLLESSSDLKRDVKPNLSRRRLQQQQQQQIIKSSASKINTEPERIRRKRAPRPPPKDLPFNPTRSAVKALMYGSFLAWGMGAVLVGFTAWSLEVKSFSEFGDVMRKKSQGLAPYLRNVLSLQRHEGDEGKKGHVDDDRDLSEILLDAEKEK